MEVEITSHIIFDQDESKTKGKAEKKGGNRIGYNYIVLKSLKESQKNDVVKCLYFKSLTDFGICVIKEGTYGDSKDRDGRDIKDKLKWQKQLHQQLQDKVRIPRLLGSFEENGNYYLVLERIKGKSLAKYIHEKSEDLRQGLAAGTKLGISLLDYMANLTILLENLHSNHVVHRDVSAANFMIMPNGEMALIDMELSYSLDQQLPSPPFQLGTYGYMCPEQEAMQAPAIEHDIFSVGAILLQALTGISTLKLTNAVPEALCSRVRFLVPDKLFSEMIVQLLNSDAKKRPSLEKVRSSILEFKRDLRVKKQRPQNIVAFSQPNEIKKIIQQAIGTLSSPLLADTQKGWFSEDKHAEVNPDKRKIVKAWYGSFNNGAAGILYLLSQANQLGFDTSAAAPYVQHALGLIEGKYINRIDQVSPSLYFGASGIAACLSLAIKQRLINPRVEHFDWMHHLLDTGNSELGIMSGLAGQGIAHWHCQPYLNGERVQQKLATYVEIILSRQEKDGGWINTNLNKEKKMTRGFARGGAGIVYFLLEFSRRYNNPVSLAAAQRGLLWLMKKSESKKDSIIWSSSNGKTVSPWWCEGGPGIALTFLKAYSLLEDPIYKNYATGALHVHNEHLLNSNLSQCHGLSGLGEVYLEAWDVLREQEWIDRASWIAQVVLQLKQENLQHGPYWLVEYERQPVADFMIGNSGIIHFLIRFCYPDKVGFPMLKV